VPFGFHQLKSGISSAILSLILIADFNLPQSASGAFGLSNNDGYYLVDTGAGLVFKVKQSSGDITSLNYNGIEYQDPAKGSQINSGLGTTNVTATDYGTNYIKITVVDTTRTLTHYYLARNGCNNIYMATYFTQEPSIGLVRFIVRIPAKLLPHGPVPADIRDSTGAIEARDIFGMADGTTRSKHYSNRRLLDWSFTGAAGNDVGVWMVRSSHEGDSGGPFYRCLINQCSKDQEIYEIINYGEAQTEPFRTNVLNGPYTLAFTDGAPPDTNMDYSWIETGGLDLIGWVSNTNRGTVVGIVTGVPAGFQAVVGFANGRAQYWAVATNGSYTTPLMIPGNYIATLYKQELEVATTSFTVAAGVTNTLNLVSREASPTYIWKLGEWDGTPAGFLNADKVTTMHPSDVRMGNWNPGIFIVGASNPATGIPCYQWKDVNSNLVIRFKLTAGQMVDSTLRIGITVAYAGARPDISVNSWMNDAQLPSSRQPKTRTLTVGTYRGNNTTFTFAVPASALVAGTNTLTVFPISGSGTSKFLSAGYGLDCIEWDASGTNILHTAPTGFPAKAAIVK
jgi:rhamnogalacturonan endolyase